MKEQKFELIEDKELPKCQGCFLGRLYQDGKFWKCSFCSRVYKKVRK